MNRRWVDGSSVEHGSPGSLSGKRSINWEHAGRDGLCVGVRLATFPLIQQRFKYHNCHLRADG